MKVKLTNGRSDGSSIDLGTFLLNLSCRSPLEEFIRSLWRAPWWQSLKLCWGKNKEATETEGEEINDLKKKKKAISHPLYR